MELTAGEGVARTADDLRDATQSELDDVQIRVRNPDVTVKLNSGMAYASTYARNDAVARVLVDDIAEYVSARRVLFARNVRSFWWAYTFPLLGAGVPLLLADSGSSTSTLVIGLVATALIGLAVAVIYAQSAARYLGSVVIVPQQRREGRGLSRQGRSEIVIGVVGAVAGSMITRLIEELFSDAP